MDDRRGPFLAAIALGLLGLTTGCSSTTTTTAGTSSSSIGTTAPVATPVGTAPTTIAAPTTTAAEPATTATTSPPTTSAPVATLAPASVVATGATASAAVPNGTYAITVSATNGSTIITANGAYNRGSDQSGASLDLNGLADIVATLPGLGTTVAGYLRTPVQAVTVGGDVYLNWQVLALAAGSPTPWIRFPPSPKGAGVGLPTTDASGAFELLGGTTVATPGGTETIGGTLATRYAVTVDTGQATAMAPPTRQAVVAAFAKLFGSPATLTADVWVGADGRVRRVRTAVPSGTFITAIGGPAVASVIGPAQLGPNVTFTLDLSPGAGATINVPAPAEVTLIDPAKLASITG